MMDELLLPSQQSALVVLSNEKSGSLPRHSYLIADSFRKRAIDCLTLNRNCEEIRRQNRLPRCQKKIFHTSFLWPKQSNAAPMPPEVKSRNQRFHCARRKTAVWPTQCIHSSMIWFKTNVFWFSRKQFCSLCPLFGSTSWHHFVPWEFQKWNWKKCQKFFAPTPNTFECFLAFLQHKTKKCCFQPVTLLLLDDVPLSSLLGMRQPAVTKHLAIHCSCNNPFRISWNDFLSLCCSFRWIDVQMLGENPWSFSLLAVFPVFLKVKTSVSFTVVVVMNWNPLLANHDQQSKLPLKHDKLFSLLILKRWLTLPPLRINFDHATSCNNLCSTKTIEVFLSHFKLKLADNTWVGRGCTVISDCGSIAAKTQMRRKTRWLTFWGWKFGELQQFWCSSKSACNQSNMFPTRPADCGLLQTHWSLDHITFDEENAIKNTVLPKWSNVINLHHRCVLSSKQNANSLCFFWKVSKLCWQAFLLLSPASLNHNELSLNALCGKVEVWWSFIERLCSAFLNKRIILLFERHLTFCWKKSMNPNNAKGCLVLPCTHQVSCCWTQFFECNALLLLPKSLPKLCCHFHIVLLEKVDFSFRFVVCHFLDKLNIKSWDFFIFLVSRHGSVVCCSCSFVNLSSERHHFEPTTFWANASTFLSPAKKNLKELCYATKKCLNDCDKPSFAKTWRVW